MAKRASSRIAPRSREFWFSHFAQWQRSELSKVDYCRQHDLYPGTFYNWCHTFLSPSVRPADRQPSDQPLQLIPVAVQHPRVADSTATVSVTCSSLTATLPADLPAELLQRWLNALAQLHA